MDSTALSRITKTWQVMMIARPGRESIMKKADVPSQLPPVGGAE
jgi:hypothetical protein